MNFYPEGQNENLQCKFDTLDEVKTAMMNGSTYINKSAEFFKVRYSGIYNVTHIQFIYKVSFASIYEGENIRVVLRKREPEKLTFSLKELLGTWKENAALFEPGETVTGTVRSNNKLNFHFIGQY